MTKAGRATPYIGSTDQSASSSRSGGYPPSPRFARPRGSGSKGREYLRPALAGLVTFKMSEVYSIPVLQSNVNNRPWFNNPSLDEQSTAQDIVDASQDPLIDELERQGYPVRDVLAGRKRLNRIKTFDCLSTMTRQIHSFVEGNRENWADTKEGYQRVEKNFAKTVFKLVMTAEANCVFRLGVYPPMTQEDFSRLEFCFDFEPFGKHLAKGQVKEMERAMDNMKEYFELYGEFKDDLVRRMNQLDKQLRVQVRV